MTKVPVTTNPRQFVPAFRSRTAQLFRLFRNANCTATMLAVVLLAGGTLFSASANASCNRWLVPKEAAPIPKHVASALASFSAASASENSDEQASIVGLWHVKFFQSPNLVYDEGFDVWHADGTEILNDNGVPPAQGNVCLGVWKKTGPRTYKLKHPAWNWDMNNQGILTGTLIIHETVTVDADGDRYTGSFTFDFYDLNGNFSKEDAGYLEATRISVD